MNKKTEVFITRIIADESGQVLPWVALLSVLFLGMAGLSLDLGGAYVAERELQSSTDAAALAGAQSMLTAASTTAVQATVQQYSSVAGNYNASPNLPNASLVSVNFACVSSLVAAGVPCVGPGTNNAIQVRQTAQVPTMFIRMLGLFGVRPPSSLTLAAVSTASMKGGQNSPYNLALVFDSSGTMATGDSTCGSGDTRLTCAFQGAQQLLEFLTPCATGTSGVTCQGFDTVSIFTFPGVVASSASHDTTCPTTSVTTAQYYAPTMPTYNSGTGTYTWPSYSMPTGSNPSYQITNYLSDYTTNSQQGGTLNTGSDVGAAVNAGGGSCKGLQTPNGRNGDNYMGTFYAGAILAAADSLNAQYVANPNSYNTLVILSDGDASACYQNGGVNNFSKCEDGSAYGTQMSASSFSNNTGAYPSYMDQCQQGIMAANVAKAIPHTTVYTISYGSPSSGCATDTSNAPGVNRSGITPCQTLLAMATNPSDFFTDSDTSNPSACTGGSAGSLPVKTIFSIIAFNTTQSRLLPNSTFP